MRTIAALAMALAVVGCGVASGGAVAPRRQPAQAVAALPAVVTGYQGGVRVTGQVIVTFSAGPACGMTGQCDVTSGTMSWTPPSSGGIEVVDLGANRHPRLEGFLDLSGTARPSSLTSVQHAGAGTCVDTGGIGDSSDLPISDAGHQRLKFGLWGTPPPLTLFSVEKTPTSLGYAFIASGPQVDEPAPTHCGGPVPADFMPLIPSRTVSLAALAHGRTRIDLSGTASFVSHGLRGTVRSTIVLHVARLRGRKEHTRPRQAPRNQDNRVITLHYEVVKVAGSITVDATSDASTCAAFDVCGLSGTVTAKPDAAHGQADVIAYDTADTSPLGLRRAAGLAPGRVPAFAQVYGLATWSSASSTVSSSLARNGAHACHDLAPFPVGGVELAVTGAKVHALFGGADLAGLPPVRDLLRTRCPGPVLRDIQPQQQHALASSVFPVQEFAQPTLTLHLTKGINVVGPGFSWRSRPNLTIVLRRTSVTERLVPSSYFET